MEKTISKKWKVNGKAEVASKVKKEKVLELLGNKVRKEVATKTYKIVNGIPVSIKTGKPLIKIEK